MTIVDYASLQAAVADEMHRLDMGARIPLFIDQAHSDISVWVKDYTPEQVSDGSWEHVPYVLAALVNPSDSNDALAAFPNAYLYGATARGMMFTRDYQAQAAYQALFQAELLQLANSDLGLRSGFVAQGSTRLWCYPRRNGRLSFNQGL